MKISIQKYDPSIDAASHVVEYDVPHTENMTVLEAIIYIHENLEPLAFDYSCRGRMCGRCAVMLNGEPCMACTTAIGDKDNAIAPLNGFPVVRDLIVDKQGLHDVISTLEQRVRSSDVTVQEFEKPVDFENVYLPSYALEMCCRCGCCVASCPVVNAAGSSATYVGPAGMIAVAYRELDPYDQGDRITQAVQEGMWNCIMCGKCDEVCPAKINHIDTWVKLRDAASKRGLTEKKRNVYLFD